MSDQNNTHEQAFKTLAWPLRLTRFGMLAERGARAFWPLWTVVFVALAAVLFGAHETLSRPVLLAALICVALSALLAAIWGLRRFHWPTQAGALDRLDATLPGRPIAALADHQAIGAGDEASEFVWRAHVARMAQRVAQARAVHPDLRLSGQDRYGLRYVAVIALAAALLFGSLWRVGTVAEGLSPSGAALASAQSWEGWVEPPAYTGKPSLYLNDITTDVLTVPQGSHVTVRFYGEPGVLGVKQDVSDTLAAPDDLSHRFRVERDGDLTITGPGGRGWEVAVSPDNRPLVTISEPLERAGGGGIQQPFKASDDFGVVAGSVTITLDLDAVDRRYGLGIAPEPRAPIVVDLPMPISGKRTEFEETLIENFSEHPWARLPVVMQFEVSDRLDQTGQATPIYVNLGGRRFFDPAAAALIEMRRDLLWSRDNGARVVQVLRAVTYRPEDLFSDDAAAYLPLRMALKRLAAGVEDGLTSELRDEISQVLWDVANLLEDGTLAGAKARLERAQERLSEAIRRGADEAEIAELMKELNDAMQDYIRQLAENAEQQEQETDQVDNGQQSQEITPDQLQQMLDRIQELMEQGRMAEAQQLLEELRQMMENMQVTQGQGGGQQSPGDQAMEGLAETLRDQQGLSDDAFRDLQEQFNPGAQAGRNRGNEGRSGGEGRGQSHEGQGEGEGDSGQKGENGGGEQSLAERQQALRDELRRQQENLPGVGGDAGRDTREALDRAGRAMEGAEDALRDEDIAGALDKQAEAMEALREGMRNLGEAMAEQQQQNRPGQQGEGQGRARADARDPLGRQQGSDGQIGTDGDVLGDDLYDRSVELLDEIRRRSSEQERPTLELDYLRRLLDQF